MSEYLGNNGNTTTGNTITIFIKTNIRILLYGKLRERERCDWLSERARWSDLARWGLPAVFRKKKFHRKPCNKSFIDQVCSVNMAGYWLRSFFASLWTSTSSPSINTQKKKLGQYPAILTSHLVNNPYI